MYNMWIHIVCHLFVTNPVRTTLTSACGVLSCHGRRGQPGFGNTDCGTQVIDTQSWHVDAKCTQYIQKTSFCTHMTSPPNFTRHVHAQTNPI